MFSYLNITQTFKSKQNWSEMFQALKENNFISRLRYLAKLSLKIDGEISYFYDEETAEETYAHQISSRKTH